MSSSVRIEGAGVAGMLAALAMSALGIDVTIQHVRGRRPTCGMEIVDGEFCAILDTLQLGRLWETLATKQPIDVIRSRWLDSDGSAWDRFRPFIDRWAIDRAELERGLTQVVSPLLSQRYEF